MTAPKRVGVDLPASAELAPLFEHLRRLQAFDVAVKRALPAELHDHVRVGNYREGTLVLLVADPIWATRLRLIADTLPRHAAMAAVERVQRITVKVSPSLLDSPGGRLG